LEFLDQIQLPRDAFIAQKQPNHRLISILKYIHNYFSVPFSELIIAIRASISDQQDIGF
jgi:hypothetical protein